MVIEITKQDPKVSFEKQDGSTMDLTLSWGTRIDVDLACMYELTDGTKEVVQALENPITGKGNFGSLGKPPFVLLDKDDRSGGMEKLTVNMTRADRIKRLLMFAWVYDQGTWKDVKEATVEARHSRLGSFIIKIDGSNDGKYAKSCALAEMRNVGDGHLEMERLEGYFAGTHVEIDKYYGFGIDWGAPGSKT